MNWAILFAILATVAPLVTYSQHHKDLKLHLVTVASEDTDGLKRLRYSAAYQGYELNVLGLGQKWNGGDMLSAGGGQKIRILREGLPEDMGQRESTVILFVDAYDVIINGDLSTLFDRFTWEFSETRILFGAEPFCWPEPDLQNQYPPVKFGERFLNSGLIMGYAPDFVKMIELLKEVGDEDDDQLAYTKLYLNPKVRKELKMSLDSLSRIFVNLNGQKNNIKLEMGSNGNPEIYNHVYNTHPLIIHGNGPSKVLLNSFGNYIGGQQNMLAGCVNCPKLKDLETKPTLTLGLFIARPIPYVEEFLQTVSKLSYDWTLVDLYVYNNQEYNFDEVKKWLKEESHKFRSVKAVNLDGTDERIARKDAMTWASKSGVDYYLSLDADAHLTTKEAVSLLIQRSQASNLDIVAPLLLQRGKLFSNFWGAISASGFYSRSEDYVDIVEGRRRGSFNVPFLNSAILVAARRLPKLANSFVFNADLDPDMSFAAFCRENGHFMFVDNQQEYGFLVLNDFFDSLTPQTIHKELYDYPNNKELWESRYIDPLFHEAVKPGTHVEQPCPDVFDFPFVTERFAHEIIAVMNNYGQWSSGNNEDERLAGGYENVPTRDIHFKQVGLHNQWLKVLDDFAGPMQEKLFEGYYSRPVHADMMFVVRYKPEEQSFLRPHLDASTYSVDIALNKRGVDFEGGGVRYVRYNCTVPADTVGHSMMFPGRLTHLHEGLPTTKGTRYILVSFVNP